ncbi:MAG: hypothetical protein MPK62_00800 [Alphaproteobacteria bacterium]|nr:hypothetical protein [Alphaproteobacteria bacterium]
MIRRILCAIDGAFWGVPDEPCEDCGKPCGRTRPWSNHRPRFRRWDGILYGWGIQETDTTFDDFLSKYPWPIREKILESGANVVFGSNEPFTPAKYAELERTVGIPVFESEEGGIHYMGLHHSTTR